MTTRVKCSFEGTQKLKQDGLCRAGAHQTDAPDASGERAEPGADLDAVALEQMPANGCLGAGVHRGGHLDRIQRPQALARGRKKIEVHRGERGGERLVCRLVPGPSRREPFFLDDLFG